MSVWIRHVQTQQGPRTIEYFENLTYRGQSAPADTADQVKVADTTLNLATFEIVVIEELPPSGELHARIYFEQQGTVPNRTLVGCSARGLRDALIERTVTGDQ
ncbi:MAG TPA: hypothetical protein VFI42_00770 [Thermomicrobiaceae bacterium]|nr:hypothetical protein [Thermomicrobiaceae bacterium]